MSAAQNVTVEEVVAAYKQACQKLNCKQIPKLLKQIQVGPPGTLLSRAAPPVV